MDFLVLPLAVYLLVTLAATLAQRSMMYFPQGTLPEPAAVASHYTAQKVTLTTADGLELVSWFHPPPDENALVVVHFHGNAGRIDQMVVLADRLVAAGHGVLLLEYRGYGGNPGSPSEEGLVEDGRAALRFLAGRGIGPERLVFWGWSLGSGVATLVAAETAPRGLILEAPFTAAVDVAAERYWFLPARFLMWDRFDSRARLAQMNVPVLILHGERDRDIPVHHGRALLEAAAGPKTGRFYPAAGHQDLAFHGAIRDALAWITALPPR